MSDNLPLPQAMMDAIAAPDPNPYYFEVGQIVRVRKHVTKDGQTPKEWAGARAKVVRRYSSVLYKEHWYVLRIRVRYVKTGVVREWEDDFREYEIDARFRRGKRAPKVRV